MWYFIIVGIFISGHYCEAVVPEKTFTKKVVDPNRFDNIIFEAENDNGNVLFGFESVSPEYEFCKKKNSEENAVNFNLTMRRLVNLLLNSAHFKDSEGNTVALESFSSPQHGELIMSITVSVNPSELEILREYGLKKKNLAVRQIDELLTNLLTADVSRWWNDCKPWSWFETWNGFINKVDSLKVVFIGSFICLILSLKKLINGGVHSYIISSWIIFLLILMSTLWEYSRMLEEETIKQYSESLRLGQIPEHCLGIDNRKWWQVFFRDDSKEQCFLHHYHKNSNPMLRVTLWKAFLSQFLPFVDVIVYSFRKLIAFDPNQWFLVNILTQGIICSSLVAIIAIYFVIKFNGVLKIPFGYIKRNNESLRLDSQMQSGGNIAGSRVQPLLSEEGSESEEAIRPPPRRKNGNKKKLKENDETDGKSSMAAYVFNITGENVHLSVPSTPGKSGPRLDSEKDMVQGLDQGVKKNCELCGNISTPEKTEKPGTKEGGIISENEEAESLGMDDEKAKDLNGGKNCDIKVQNFKTDISAKDDSLNDGVKKLID